MPNEIRGYDGPGIQPGHSRTITTTEIEPTTRFNKNPGDPLGRGPYNGPIPRIRARQQNNNMINNNNNNNINHSNNNKYDTYSDTVKQKRNVRRFDTFGENAIETIYDEFRFLDETDAPSPSHSQQQILPPTTKEKEFTSSPTSLIAFCFLPFLQLLCSLSLFSLAVIRLYKLEPQSNGLFDMEKPVGAAAMSSKGSKVVQIQSACAVLLPSTFLTIGALAGFWPVAKKMRTTCQVLHIIFCLVSLPGWFEAIQSVAVEINVQYVQLEPLQNSSIYITYIVLACLGYFSTILLPSMTVFITVYRMVPYKQHTNSNILSTCLSIGTVLISATVACFSAYSVSRSFWNITDWHPTKSLSNQGALYGFGLLELLVSSYVFLSSIFFFIATIQKNRGLTIAAALLMCVCLYSITSLLFTSPRFTAVILNSIVLAADKSIFPVSQVSMILIYGFLIALLFSLTINLILTISSLRIKYDCSSSLPSTTTNAQLNTNF